MFFFFSFTHMPTTAQATSTLPSPTRTYITSSNYTEPSTPLLPLHHTSTESPSCFSCTDHPTPAGSSIYQNKTKPHWWGISPLRAAGGGHGSSAGRHAMISGKTAELQTPPQGSLSVYIDRGDYRASPPLSLCICCRWEWDLLVAV
jgi:hypothetical protein